MELLILFKSGAAHPEAEREYQKTLEHLSNLKNDPPIHKAPLC